MQISNLISTLEKIAPLKLQESYDNSGLIVGNPDTECFGVLLALDATEDVIKDAINNKYSYGTGSEITGTLARIVQGRST